MLLYISEHAKTQLERSSRNRVFGNKFHCFTVHFSSLNIMVQQNALVYIKTLI
jgi:hypothetical protein